MHQKVKKGLKIIAWLGIALLAAVVPLFPGLSQEKGKPPETREDRISRGSRAYHVYCAGCHGAGARGDGPMVAVLKVRPPDLTRFRAGNDGTFPADRVAAAIDGRAVVRGHGPSEMPVWGWSFKERGLSADEEQQVQERIHDLVLFLESIQSK
ncbi:MAG: cytochrome c [Thermoanaerobaculia bacterium]